MQTATRNGNRWTVSETLRLQREYELLEWTIQQIAEGHDRTERAILFRLEQEGFINTWEQARGFESTTLATWRDADSCYDQDDNEEVDDDAKDEDYVDQGDEEEDEDEDDYEEENSDITNLSDRVWSLETSVNDISSMMKQLVDTLLQKKAKKQKKLRSRPTH